MTVPLELAETLRSLEERLLSPEVRGVPARVAELLDEGFVEFGRSGRIYDKPGTLAALAAEAPGPSTTVADFVARLLAPGVVLVTYRASHAVDDESLRSSVRVLRGNAWRLVFHQGTRALR